MINYYRVVVVGVALLLCGCGSGEVTTNVTPATGITLKPDTLVVALGDHTKQFTAKDASGNVLSDAQLSWSSANGSVADVAAGFVVPTSPGITKVSSSVPNQALTGSAVVVVTGLPTCNLQLPATTLRSLRASVDYDPGDNASFVSFGDAVQANFSFSGATNSRLHAGVVVQAFPPFVTVSGGFVNGCAFEANAQGDVGPFLNVPVRLSGVWTDSAMDLKYTVGTTSDGTGPSIVYDLQFVP
jgi:hypothetical protein